MCYLNRTDDALSTRRINGADKPSTARYRTVHIGRWRWMALSGGGRKVRRLFSARNLVVDRAVLV
jgi:hypothetical protein